MDHTSKTMHKADGLKLGDRVSFANGRTGEVVNLGKYKATVRYTVTDGPRAGEVVNETRTYRGLVKA